MDSDHWNLDNGFCMLCLIMEDSSQDTRQQPGLPCAVAFRFLQSVQAPLGIKCSDPKSNPQHFASAWIDAVTSTRCRSTRLSCSCSRSSPRSTPSTASLLDDGLFRARMLKLHHPPQLVQRFRLPKGLLPHLHQRQTT